MKVHAYELLYRGSARVLTAEITDGDAATRSLLSDAITVFGLHKLTNAKPAFINFTDSLLLNDFVLTANPKEIVVELLETIEITDSLLAKLAQLKQLGYQLALDDYTGDPRFDEILPFVSIIKVDFMDAGEVQRREIAARFARSPITLLAEKVETVADFEMASSMGYTLFQGYFFEKPMILNKRTSSLAAASYIRLFRELHLPEIDIGNCASIVHTDATLTYQLFRKVRTMHYYRGNSVQSIVQAMMILGTEEIRRWAILMLARERNVTYSDELVRDAYLRAVFMERLMAQTPFQSRSSDGFLLGMFSLLDKIMNIPLEKVLEEVPISPDVSAALLGKEHNLFSDFLEFLLIYEMKNPALILPTLNLRIEGDYISKIYMECIAEADKAFIN